ncbi:hypothetical protein Tco_1438898, partial [Tanacetum coccineum]
HDVSKPKSKKKTIIPTVKKIEFVKAKQDDKAVRNTIKYAEMYRSQRPRGNQRNWNKQKSQQLGSDFVIIKKDCYVCGSLDHLQSGPISLNTARQSYLNAVCCWCSRQVNTARPKAVVNAIRTNRGNPKTKLEDLVRLNSPEDKKRAGAELTQQNDKSQYKK